MRVVLIAASMLALAVPSARAAEAPVTAVRAHAVASARLLDYALGFSYVVDYGVGRCTVTGPRATCSFRIVWYQEPACTGTILVEPRHHVLAARFVAPRCEPPPEATTPEPGAGSPPEPAPTPPGTMPSPPGATPAPSEAGTHTIDAIADDDSQVTLDDGSQWAIGPDDEGEVADWLSGDEVDLAQISGSTYSITDDTLADGVAVTATYAGSG